MKTLAITLITLLTAFSVSIAKPLAVLDTNEVAPFVLTIDVDRNDELFLEYKNAEGTVQVTLIEEEDGIVFVERVQTAHYAKHLPTSELREGRYTLLVEYEGNLIKSHSFRIKE